MFIEVHLDSVCVYISTERPSAYWRWLKSPLYLEYLVDIWNISMSLSGSRRPQKGITYSKDLLKIVSVYGSYSVYTTPQMPQRSSTLLFWIKYFLQIFCLLNSPPTNVLCLKNFWKIFCVKKPILRTIVGRPLKMSVWKGSLKIYRL